MGWADAGFWIIEKLWEKDARKNLQSNIVWSPLYGSLIKSLYFLFFYVLDFPQQSWEFPLEILYQICLISHSFLKNCPVLPFDLLKSNLLVLRFLPSLETLFHSLLFLVLFISILILFSLLSLCIQYSLITYTLKC